MGTIQSSATLQPLVSTTAITTVESLEKKIERVGADLRFYHQLLGWCLLGCREDKRRVIEQMREEANALRDREWPSLSEKLHRLKVKTGNGTAPSRWYGSLLETQHHLHRLDDALNTLKEKVQGGFGEFVHISIW
ncbi:MAG: hypothetical protein H6565_02155 [Lewinellaceae bacterium]|nr:hypothetical protein [Lewinellaceae bacterium]